MDRKEFSDKNIAITAKILTREDKGQGTGETIRPKMFSSASFEGSSTNSTGAGNSTFKGQTGGQSSGGQPQLGTGGGLLNNLNVLQSLDMAKDNWTEMLLQRVQKGLSGGKDQLDFQLNPRNLGKMRISLMVQNDRTHVKIQTETSAAASMLNDSEARLAQMLESSGLRLGNLNSEHFNGFGSNGFNQNDAKQNQSEMSANAESSKETDNSDNVTETIEERSKNLVNIQA